MPGASRPASGLAFHGMDQSPSTTSGEREPSASGLDHLQQNPAVSRAENPSAALPRIVSSSSCGDSTTSNLNSSVGSQSTYGVSRRSSVFSTHPTNASEPPHL